MALAESQRPTTAGQGMQKLGGVVSMIPGIGTVIGGAISLVGGVLDSQEQAKYEKDAKAAQQMQDNAMLEQNRYSKYSTLPM